MYLNLSYTNIGDFGAEIISNVIAGGQLPATRAIDVSGNNITEVGQGYFVDALQNLKQKIYITLVEAQEASKDVVQRTIKVLLDIAESNGVETREVVSTYDTIQHCKKGFPNVAKNIVGGLVSCVIPVAKYTNLEELTLQDVGTDLLAVIIPESAPYLEGACITEAIFFSIVDEDFANCLIGVDNHF